MMDAKPHKEHEWLKQFVGQWSYEHEAPMAPGEPPSKFAGIETVRSLGDLWILCEGRGELPGGGGPAITLMTLGYDPARKRFVGSFIGSMMTHLWPYDGTLSGNVLTLDSEGPSFTDQTKMGKYQDVVELKSPDHRVLTARTLGDDGRWTEFMTAHYRRVK